MTAANAAQIAATRLSWVRASALRSRVLTFEINEATFSIGLVLQAALNFLFVAAAVYFVIVMPLNKLAERRARGIEPEPEPLTTEQQLLTEIRDALQTRS